MLLLVPVMPRIIKSANSSLRPHTPTQVSPPPRYLILATHHMPLCLTVCLASQTPGTTIPGVGGIPPTTPGVIPTPGVPGAPGVPGVVPGQPGVVPPQPGVVPPQPGVVPPQPGVVPPQPGVVPPRPGVVPPVVPPVVSCTALSVQFHISKQLIQYDLCNISIAVSLSRCVRAYVLLMVHHAMCSSFSSMQSGTLCHQTGNTLL